MTYRIVLYRESYLASAEDIRVEIERAAGIDQKLVAAQFRSSPAVFLNNLEETPARQLFEVKRGLIYAHSASLLYHNFGIDPPSKPILEKKKDPERLTRAVFTLGAVLIGLGLVLFVAANWQRIPPAVKIVGSMLLTLSALHAAYQLKFVRKSESGLAPAFFFRFLSRICG